MDLLARMETFVRIVDGGSLSSAARAMRLSLPAISRQLAALEADLDTPLIVRSTRRLRITEAGQRWYAHCVRILRDLDAARADVAADTEVSGTVVISAPISIGLVHVVPRLSALSKRHPRLAVELRLEDHLVDLIGDNVDLAVRGGVPPPDSAGLIAHPILRIDRQPVAAPSYLRRRGTPRDPADLVEHDCLVQHGARGPLATWELVRGDDRRSITVSGRLCSSAPLALHAWARDGLGVALLPPEITGDDLAAGRLRRVLPGWSIAPVTAWALHRVELRGSPRLRAVVDALARDGVARGG
jgi:DNA-binding transcriptional LysR family regulator